jgi:hypothetical protein
MKPMKFSVMVKNEKNTIWNFNLVLEGVPGAFPEGFRGDSLEDSLGDFPAVSI